MTAEFMLFFAIGLGILLFEAHRQFNHPAYSKSPDDEAVGDTKQDYIFSLAPSEIRNRSAFFSAELVYILAIVALYLLLIFNDAVNNVLEYIIHFRAQDADPGGALPPPATGATAAATQAAVDGEEAAIDQAAAPFVVSMMMVTALRFPFVRRLEVLLRSSAQRLFGIPWIPHRLRQKIEDTPVDLEAVEAELPAEDGVSYQSRIREYRQQALAVGASQGRMNDLVSTLAKLAVYQLWVNDLKLWPSQEFRSDYGFFRELNDPMSEQISALFKDCDLLASSMHEQSVEGGPSHDERRRMQQELWELKARQARDLSRKLAAMMALYDQNSKLPESDRAGAASLRAFLEHVRAKDEAKVFQVNVAILLLLISAAVSFVAGYVHAGWLASIARDLGVFDQVGADDPQFDRFLTARNFTLSSLIVYGLSMWAALDIRRRLQRNGNWTNPFEPGRRIPPMGQLALFFAALAALVFAATWLYLLLTSPGWSPMAERTDPWWDNVWRQANLSLIFGIIGGFHGTAVALMMDLGARKVDARRWLYVAAGYIAAMMLLGYGLGQYYSGSSAEPIRAMREMLYAIDLGLIALFTSIAMISFLQPAVVAPEVGGAAAEGPAG